MTQLPASWRRASVCGMVLVVAAALVAYHNSFSVHFVLDDHPVIARNPTIRALWPLSVPLSPPEADGTTVAGRPLVNLTPAVSSAKRGSCVSRAGEGIEVKERASRVAALIPQCVSPTPRREGDQQPTILTTRVSPRKSPALRVYKGRPFEAATDAIIKSTTRRRLPPPTFWIAAKRMPNDRGAEVEGQRVERGLRPLETLLAPRARLGPA